MSEFRVGEKVKIAPQYARAGEEVAVYTVVRVPQGARGRNYTLEAVAPGARGYRAPGYALVRATDEEVKSIEEIPYVAPPVLGAVVTVSLPDFDSESLYVVLGGAKNKPNASRLARLGGDNNRYFTAVPNSLITVVDPASISVKEPVGV